MSGQSRRPDYDGQIRETFEEFQVGDTMVAMISDPHDETAWIQSDVTWPVEQ